MTVLWTPKGFSQEYNWLVEPAPAVMELPVTKKVDEEKPEVQQNENVEDHHKVIMPVKSDD